MDRGKQQSHQQHFRTEHCSLPVIPAQAGIQDFVMHPLEFTLLHFHFGIAKALSCSRQIRRSSREERTVDSLSLLAQDT